MSLDRFLAAVSRSHFPNSPATLQQLQDFETRVGWRLDDDLRAFYLRFDGAALFKRPDSPYRLLSLSEVIRARVALYGTAGDTDAYGSPSWYVICSVRDGDYVAIDVSRSSHGRFPVFDCFHALKPGSAGTVQIAWSFCDFLERALHSEGRLYWLARNWDLEETGTS